MVTFNINLELSADTGWTPDDVAVALGELAAEYKLELDGAIIQVEGGKEVERRSVTIE
jgi:hypothetical protein